MDKFEKALGVAEMAIRWGVKLIGAAMRKDSERVDKLLRDGFQMTAAREEGERRADEIVEAARARDEAATD